jgi:putative heme-binding domain-containing protein
VKPLVELIQKVPANDITLRHAARIALRDCLRDGDHVPEAWKVAESLTGGAAEAVAGVALGLPTPASAEYLTKRVADGSIPNERLPATAEHIGRYGTAADWRTVISRVSEPKNGGARAMAVLHAIVRGVQASGKRIASADLYDLLMTQLFTELRDGTKDSRLAALRVLADVPPVLADGARIRETHIDPISGALKDTKQPDDVRSAALEALVRFDGKRGFAEAVTLIDNVNTSPALREKAALVLAASGDRNHKQAAKDAITAVPYRSGVVIAAALAGSKPGGDIHLDAVKQGKAPARLLQEKGILDKLRAAGVPNLDQRVAALTKGLPPADQKLAALIKQRTARLASAKPDREAGAKLFAKHCAACHRIGDQGGKVGPNLDGVGIRGLERLLEDTLDPNRNVDAAFRARVLNLTDGTTKTGLMLRVEGEVLVMADDQGKEFRVPTKDIESNRETALSPMPANFGEVIPEAEFRDLIGYLLEQRVKDPPKKP